MPCLIWSAASGHSEARWRLCGLAAWLRHGFAQLDGDVEILLLHAPGAAMAGAALDHRRSRSAGKRRSISAAFGPMFCARAWQARCTATPPSSGFRPGASPSFLAISTTYSLMSKVARASRFDVLVAGQEQRPFELQHQRAGRHQRDDVVALVDQRHQSPGHALRIAGHAREVALLELRHAAAAGIDTSVSTPLSASTARKASPMRGLL